MKKLTHKTRLSWLFQLTSSVYLLLATLPQGDAAQVKSLEKPQLRLEVASNKLEGAKHTTQVALTNLSIATIGPTQYSLVVREKHGQAVKVYYQNTADQVMELALEEPTDLAALIGIDTLHIGAVGTFTLILKPGQDTGHIRLMFSIEDAQRNPVSEPASVTWRLKRCWTLPKVFIGVGLAAAATVLMIMPRFFANPANKPREDTSNYPRSGIPTAPSLDQFLSVNSCRSDSTRSCPETRSHTASPATKLRHARSSSELRSFTDPYPDTDEYLSACSRPNSMKSRLATSEDSSPQASGTTTASSLDSLYSARDSTGNCSAGSIGSMTDQSGPAVEVFTSSSTDNLLGASSDTVGDVSDEKVASSTSSSTVNGAEQSNGIVGEPGPVVSPTSSFAESLLAASDGAVEGTSGTKIKEDTIVDAIFLEKIMSALVNIKSMQDARSQLNTLKELMSMPGAKQRIEELNKQIGPDPTLDKLLKHWRKVTLGTYWRPWGVGRNKIQAIIRSLGLEALLAKLLQQYDKDISPVTRSKAKELLAQGGTGEF